MSERPPPSACTNRPDSAWVVDPAPTSPASSVPFSAAASGLTLQILPKQQSRACSLSSYQFLRISLDEGLQRAAYAVGLT